LEIKKEKQQKTSKISWIVFFASLAVAIPTLVSFLFPAVILSLITSTPDPTVNPFQLGVHFIPFFAANLLVLGIYLMYTSQNLPTIVQKSIKFIFNFDVSQRISLLVILILLSLYVALTFHELAEPELWGDFLFVEAGLQGWPFDNPADITNYHFHTKNALLYISENIFQNIKAVPFIASILLVFLTYLFTVQITNKRFAGLVAMAIVLQSQTFLLYDTTPTYAKGSLFQVQGEYEKALTYFDRILEIDPNYVDALFGKGGVLGEMGDIEMSIYHFVKVQRLEPNFLGAEINLYRALKSLPVIKIGGNVMMHALDSDGKLFMYQEIPTLFIHPLNMTNEFLDTLPVKEVITRDGKDYEVLKLRQTAPIEHRTSFSEVSLHPEGFVDFPIVRTANHGFKVQPGDTLVTLWTIYRPID